MRHNVRRLWVGASFAFLLGVGVTWAAQAGLKLYVNGRLASSRVILHGGEAYAPIGDLARALSMGVVHRADGYSMSGAGGANQLEGVTGRVGQVLFNGKYRFQVLKVFRGTEYTKQFDPGHQTVGTGRTDQVGIPTGMDFVAISCRLKNGVRRTESVSLLGSAKTALTDKNGHSYEAPRGGWSDVSNGTPDLLPGAAADFALTFLVPPNEELKDLVFSVDDGPPTNGPDFRVSLEGAAATHP